MSSVVKTVCIIGAGIGGLSVAALLVQRGVGVTVFEKTSKLGGRTASMIYRNHILDNGFHVMPFYKKSAIYEVLKKVGIKDRLTLAKVRDIAFYDVHTFPKYPRGINDILRLSLVPLQSRINLLKILIPLAFSRLEKTEKWDEISLKQIKENLDLHTKSFLRQYVCLPSLIFQNIYHLESLLVRLYVLIRLEVVQANLDIRKVEDMILSQKLLQNKLKKQAQIQKLY